MKHKGSICEYADDRNYDIIRVYRHLIRTKTHINTHTLFYEIANSPSRRFWVSEERAYAVVNSMMTGKDVDIKGKARREMFEEIYKRCRRIKEHFPHKPLFHIVVEVVNSPAPKFFLTPRTIRELIYRMRRKAKSRSYEDEYK